MNKKLISKNITPEIEQIINRLARVKIQFHNANINKDYKYSKFFLQSNLFHIIYKNEDILEEIEDKDLSFLKKELESCIKEIKRLEEKLKNNNFIEKAPKKVVDENRNKLTKVNNNKKKILLEINSLSKKE